MVQHGLLMGLAHRLLGALLQKGSCRNAARTGKHVTHRKGLMTHGKDMRSLTGSGTHVLIEITLSWTLNPISLGSASCGSFSSRQHEVTMDLSIHFGPRSEYVSIGASLTME
jgi:hypothetical protein